MLGAKEKRGARQLRWTREGVFFALMACGTALAGLNTGNNLLYLLVGWLVTMLVVSAVISEATLRGLEPRRRAPGRAVANRPFAIDLALANRKRKIPSLSIELEDVAGRTTVDKTCYFLKIPAGREQVASYRHTFPARGLYRYAGVRASTSFPFGLLRRSRTIPLPGEIVVYPAVYAVTPPRVPAHRAGELAAERAGRRGEFFGLREYREGDERRDIHWRSSARAGRLVVVEYQEEAQRRVSVLLDNALPENPPPAHAEDALEEAVSLAASLASSYLAEGFAVALGTREGGVPPGAGPGQRERILHALALVEPAGPEAPLRPPGGAAAEAVLVAPRGVAVPGRPRGVSRVVEAG